MAEEFLSHFERGFVPPADGDGIAAGGRSPSPRRLRMLLIGDAADVRWMIHRIHVVGIAAAGDWSPLVPVPNAPEVMSILVIRCPQA